MDVICVFDGNSKPFCTDFYVRFRSPFVDEATVSVLGLNDVPNHDDDHPIFPVVDAKRLSESATKAHLSGQSIHKNDHIQISVNGKNLPDIKAFIGEEQFLFFYDPHTGQHSRTPSPDVLTKFNLVLGKNTVTCIHFGSNIYKEFNIWRLENFDSLIVMDIDGTITKSDITGYIQTVYMGLFSHVHDGIVPFLNTLRDRYHHTIVYLTARPLIHQRETRLLLEGIKDSAGRTMPDGPLFPSKDKLLAALYREVISKTTVKLKSGVLGEINRVFRRAGCMRITPFVLGVGNKENDAFAYNLAGLNAENILLIDKSSRIEVWKHKQLQQMQQQSSSHARRMSHSAHGSMTVAASGSSTTTVSDVGVSEAERNAFTHSNSDPINNTTNHTTISITNTTSTTGGRSPRLERGVSEGATVLKAVTPNGSEKFAVVREDGMDSAALSNTTHATNGMSIDTTLLTTHTSTSNNSAKSTNSSSSNTTGYSEHSHRVYSTDCPSNPSSARNSTNISVSNNDYFNYRSSTDGATRSLSTTDNVSPILSTSAGVAEVNDFQSCSLPAEKRSIWGFMQRKSPSRDVSEHNCINTHVFHTYNDDRLMEYVHKMCNTD